MHIGERSKQNRVVWRPPSLRTAMKGLVAPSLRKGFCCLDSQRVGVLSPGIIGGGGGGGAAAAAAASAAVHRRSDTPCENAQQQHSQAGTTCEQNVDHDDQARAHLLTKGLSDLLGVDFLRSWPFLCHARHCSHKKQC